VKAGDFKCVVERRLAARLTVVGGDELERMCPLGKIAPCLLVALPMSLTIEVVIPRDGGSVWQP